MRGFSSLLVFALGCTVAVDDFERCEAVTISVERGSCGPEERACTFRCFEMFEEEGALTTCLRGCGPADSPCVACIFGITSECVIGVCTESYQDLTCCSLERCGNVDFSCEACQEEVIAFNACTDRVISEGAVCSGLGLDCYQN